MSRSALVVRGLWLSLLLVQTADVHAQDCIGVVTSGGGASFWQQVGSGAQAAGVAENVAVYVRGPIREGDVAGQLQIIEKILQHACKALVIAPAGAAISARAAELKLRGVSTLYIDRDAGDSSAVVAVLSTDNFNAGVMAGEQMVKLLGGHGAVALLRHQQGIASSSERERGFVQSATAGGLQVVFDQYLGDDTQLVLSNFAGAVAHLNGVFTPNQSTSLLTLGALRRLKAAGRVTHIGFDGDSVLIEAVRSGELAGVVLQQPYQMGYQGVQQAARLLRGEAGGPRQVRLAALYVNQANLDQPEVMRLLPKP
ncbi:MAG: substrate-binding domain-containing protein [Pseudomonas sp.]|uniref:substrate-binding domain-containing protein n=1 Tax=Pseudomonas sp. TaxID=306 RepID=UPI002735125C|nr:substrate-binding domain-containing protein [Pseudomonas sp.]MDP3847460.1 substrate-binding domain-containing protein [Pseudomonas sp.]